VLKLFLCLKYLYIELDEKCWNITLNEAPTSFLIDKKETLRTNLENNAFICSVKPFSCIFSLPLPGVVFEPYITEYVSCILPMCHCRWPTQFARPSFTFWLFKSRLWQTLQSWSNVCGYADFIYRYQSIHIVRARVR
jgi:hypothetical protein